MSDKKHKYRLTAKEKQMLAQRNKDREVLEQFKYQGKLIDMESSLVKSQLEEVKGLSKYDPQTASIIRSHSSVHLPPIKKQGNPEDINYLKDVRQRDYKKYMVSRNQILDNKVHQTQNDELKRKLFRMKYRKYMIHTNDDCKHAWKKLEEIETKKLNSSMTTSMIDESSTTKGGAKGSSSVRGGATATQSKNQTGGASPQKTTEKSSNQNPQTSTTQKPATTQPATTTQQSGSTGANPTTTAQRPQQPQQLTTQPPAQNTQTKPPQKTTAENNEF